MHWTELSFKKESDGDKTPTNSLELELIPSFGDVRIDPDSPESSTAPRSPDDVIESEKPKNPKPQVWFPASLGLTVLNA